MVKKSKKILDYGLLVASILLFIIAWDAPTAILGYLCTLVITIFFFRLSVLIISELTASVSIKVILTWLCVIPLIFSCIFILSRYGNWQVTLLLSVLGVVIGSWLSNSK